MQAKSGFPVGILLIPVAVALGFMALSNGLPTPPSLPVGSIDQGVTNNLTYAKGLKIGPQAQGQMSIYIPDQGGYLTVDSLGEKNIPLNPDLREIDPGKYNEFPGLEQVIPDLQDHAAIRRAMATTPQCQPASVSKSKPSPYNTGFYKVSMTYSYVTANPTEVYFSPIMGRVYVFRDNPCGDPIHAMLGVVLDAVVNNGTLVGYGKVVTVLTDRVAIEQVKISACTTIQLWKDLGYRPQYNPPTMGGQGRCLENQVS